MTTDSNSLLTDEALKMAVITAARLDGHEKTCGERYARIAADTTEIKATLVALSRDVREATQRVHDRIDGEAATARDSIKSVQTTAQEAKDGVAGTKIWVLGGVITGAVALAGLVIEFFKR